MVMNIQASIRALKAERNAAILAHNYQTMDVQEVGDHVGDSLYLARVASRLEEKVILLAGVRFMAETASVLCPEKTIIIPDLEAGCSLAGMIKSREIRAWKDKHSDGGGVAYVNTTAEVKAESDICCTSANACQVVSSLPENARILFVPDYSLGLYVQRKTGRKLDLWPGFCHVHADITGDVIREQKRLHPEARVLMHPECGCMSDSMDLADEVLSTSGMLKACERSTDKEFIIATENGMVEQLRAAHPDKVFHPVGEWAVCEYMKLHNLEKILSSLKNLEFVVKVPGDIAERARRPIERMLALS
ncbi:MAG: quinolinate synthase NadA [Candidatus Omnitrophica bacterium]|nr:quinolinate synthase NadA [Candidatus Omnitrophota bacterium]